MSQSNRLIVTTHDGVRVGVTLSDIASTSIYEFKKKACEVLMDYSMDDCVLVLKGTELSDDKMLRNYNITTESVIFVKRSSDTGGRKQREADDDINCAIAKVSVNASHTQPNGAPDSPIDCPSSANLDELNEKLVEAVLKGDINSCQQLLVQEAQPNSIVCDDKFSCFHAAVNLSCLHAAVKRGSSKIVELLLFYRADIESRSAEQREH
jgi:hypothetical protein